MDPFDVKLEKKRIAMSKHRRQLSKVANLLRFVEFFVVLILISRFTVDLPVAVKSSGEYFRGLSVAIVSPRFVFFVGNAIVITLFIKAGKFSPQDSSSGTDLYDEFLEKSEKTRAIHRYEIENRGKQRKKSVDEEKTVSLNVHNTPKGTTTKDYRRTKSENIKRTNCDKSYKQLRKSGSEKYIKHNDLSEKTVNSSYPEDGLSNEQFRNTVEAFIARQKQLLREEEYSSICKYLE